MYEVAWLLIGEDHFKVGNPLPMLDVKYGLVGSEDFFGDACHFSFAVGQGAVVGFNHGYFGEECFHLPDDFSGLL